MKKQLILVLGMHRSGTSAVTGILNILNINLGSALIGKGVDNPKGFFENFHFLELNKLILSDNNCNWDNVKYSLALTNNRREELKRLLITEFLNYDVLAIKDPRLSVLCNFYSEIALELNYDVKYIIVMRPAEEIVKSLNARNNFSYEKSYKLICSYYHYLLHIQSNKIIINFSDVVNAPLLVTKEIIQHLNLNISLDTVEIDINKFIDKSLKHHHIND